MVDAPKKKRRGRPPEREKAGADPSVTLIKKYGNRRLYDTKRSRCVTLDDLVEVIAQGEEIRVVDAQSGEDLTKRVMTQIILHEEDRKRLNLLPLSFLRKLIQYRDESMREFFQKYMSLSLDLFMQSQKAMGRRVEGMSSAFDPSQMSVLFPWMQGMPGMPGMPGMAPEAAEGPRSDATPIPSDELAGEDGDGDADDGVESELANLRRQLASLESRMNKKR